MHESDQPWLQGQQDIDSFIMERESFGYLKSVTLTWKQYYNTISTWFTAELKAWK
jgi:hypothetical protein